VGGGGGGVVSVWGGGGGLSAKKKGKEARRGNLHLRVEDVLSKKEKCTAKR